MTVTEASALLGISDGRLRTLIREGKVGAEKIGPIWTVKYSALKTLKVYGKRGRPRRGEKPIDLP